VCSSPFSAAIATMRLLQMAAQALELRKKATNFPSGDQAGAESAPSAILLEG